jgi:hypothetical protein
MTHQEEILRMTIQGLRQALSDCQWENEQLRKQVNELSWSNSNYREAERDRPENHEMGQ